MGILAGRFGSVAQGSQEQAQDLGELRVPLGAAPAAESLRSGAEARDSVAGRAAPGPSKDRKANDWLHELQVPARRNAA